MVGKSAETRITIQGQEVQPPVEWADIEVLATFGQSQANISTDNFSFILDAYNLLKDHIQAGLAGGLGIFEPVPIKIEAISTLGNYSVFEGGIRLVDAQIDDTTGLIKAPIEKDQGLNTLSDRLSGISYRFLIEKGVITPADYVDIEYQVDKPDRAFEAIVISITLFSLSRELANLTKDLAKDLATISGLAPTVVGPAIYAVASAIINVAYAAAVSVLIADLISDLIRLLVPPIRKHKGIKLKTLLEKSLSYLGYSLNTSIPELENLHYLASNPLLDIENSNTGFLQTPKGISEGIPGPGDYGYLCIEMFELTLSLFNAEFQVKDNIVELHSKNSPYWIKNSTYELFDILEGPYRYNTDELTDSILVSFQTDQSDLYTLDNYEGTSIQIITQGKTVGTTGRDNISGLSESAFPVALANRKETLSGVEVFFAGIAAALDRVANIFGINTNLLGQVFGRLGVLKVSQNNHAIPKLIYLQSGRIPSNHRQLFSAKTLWENYHSYKSFIQDGYKRQRKVFEDVRIPFGFEDFTKLVDNSYFTYQGKQGKMTRISWNISQDFAVCSFWLEEVYTKNLKETTIIPRSEGATITERD